MRNGHKDSFRVGQEQLYKNQEAAEIRAEIAYVIQNYDVTDSVAEAYVNYMHRPDIKQLTIKAYWVGKQRSEEMGGLPSSDFASHPRRRV